MKWPKLKVRLRIPFRRGTRKDLDYLLAHANPSLPLEEQIVWLSDLLNWIRSPSKLPSSFSARQGQLEEVRIRFVFHLLEKNPSWKEKTGKSILSILSQIDSLQ